MPRDARQYQGSHPRLREQARVLLDADRTCDPGCGDEPETPATASPDRMGLELCNATE